jgi:hypothetical protein
VDINPINRKTNLLIYYSSYNYVVKGTGRITLYLGGKMKRHFSFAMRGLARPYFLLDEFYPVNTINSTLSVTLTKAFVMK